MPMPHEALEENRRGVDLMAPNRPMRVGQSRDALPGVSDVDLFGYREGIIHLDAEVYLTVLSILVWPSKSCTARRFPVWR
jgi:hypothetical protein